MQFIKHEIRGDHAEYLFKIVAPNDISFELRDRYSSMRSFYGIIRNTLSEGQLSGLPNFPPKKAFGHMKPQFLQNRQNQLENFYKIMLSMPDIA